MSRASLNYKQLSQVHEITNRIINSLPDKTLNQVLDSYDRDLKEFVDDLYKTVYKVLQLNHYSSKTNYSYLDGLEETIDEVLKKTNYNYFKTVCLPEFEQGWRNIEWGNYVMLYKYLVIIASRTCGKCLHPDTEIIIYNGSIKKIKDIKVGDQVMGPDSTPRNILSIHSGIDDMYKIKQTRTLDYIVNSEHILHYRRKRQVWNNSKRMYDSFEDIIIEKSAKEFHIKSKSYKCTSKGYRVKGWELFKKEQLLEPYFLGMWLADGNNHDHTITNIDKEIINYLKKYSKRLNIGFRTRDNGKNHKITNSIPGERNFILTSLKKMFLLHNKHIPNNYLYGSRSQRLELLAGFIDGDGYYNPKNNYEITQKDDKIVKELQKLAWSLGFNATFREKIVQLSYVDKLYISYTTCISGDIWEIPVKIKRKKARNTPPKCKNLQHSSLKTEYLGKGEYIGFECDGDHLFLLKDGTVIHNSFEFGKKAYPLWRMYRYDNPSKLAPGVSKSENLLNKWGVLMSNTQTLTKKLLEELVEEIRMNDLVGWKLRPEHLSDLGREGMRAKNGCRIDLRTKDAGPRGLHPGWIVMDDILDKSVIYSKEQRDKVKNELFYAETMPALEPGGQIIISGTPFSSDDLYYWLKQDKRFRVFEYPAIFPETGKLLAPERLSYEKLMEEKESLGSLIFSREYLVKPISDAASIFPWEFLRNCYNLDLNLVENIESFPIKLKRVVVGCDFAISANIGADFVVFTVWGLGEDNKFYLLYMFRDKGLSAEKQVAQIVNINSRFKPNIIVAEDNGFQRTIIEMVRSRGVKNIQGFTTTSNIKKDLYSGLPSLAALFERRDIVLPVGDEKSKRAIETMCGEFNSITFLEDSGRLESVSGKDDTVMSSFFALNNLREKSNSLKIHYI